MPRLQQYQWNVSEPSELLACSDIPLRVLNETCRLEPGSRLKDYMSQIAPPLGCCTLAEVIFHILCDINSKKLYDPTNQSIIILSKELKWVFGVSLIHITEIKHLVCKNLLQAQFSHPKKAFIVSEVHVSSNLSLRSQPIPATPPETQTFLVPRKLNQLLQLVDPQIKSSTVFTFKQIIELLLCYIRQNANALLPNASQIVKCENTPLYSALGEINFIHRSQLELIIIQQIKVPARSKICALFRGICHVHHHYRSSTTDLTPR